MALRSPTLHPLGTYTVTDHLVTMLAKIPNTALVDPLEPTAELAFPDEEGPWLKLPHGTILDVQEQDEVLVVVHTGSGPAFESDRATLNQYLD